MTADDSATFVAFSSAPQAVAAAAAATQALAAHAWPQGATLQVRMGIHTGTPQRVGDHYVGLDVHRAARIAAAGHGGQILLSQTTRELVAQTLPAGVTLRDLGAHRLKDLQQPERLTQLVLPDLPADFSPLKTLDIHQHNLPLQLTPLLGRAEQAARLLGAVAVLRETIGAQREEADVEAVAAARAALGEEAWAAAFAAGRALPMEWAIAEVLAST